LQHESIDKPYEKEQPKSTTRKPSSLSIRPRRSQQCQSLERLQHPFRLPLSTTTSPSLQLQQLPRSAGQESVPDDVLFWGVINSFQIIMTRSNNIRSNCRCTTFILVRGLSVDWGYNITASLECIQNKEVQEQTRNLEMTYTLRKSGKVRCVWGV
jgi:hypothetical protein